MTELDDAHDAAVRAVLDAATHLHALTRGIIDRTEQLNAQAAQLRARIAQLERTDQLPPIPGWEQAGDFRHRGSDLWRVWNVSRNPQHRGCPDAVLDAIHAAARGRLHRAARQQRS